MHDSDSNEQQSAELLLLDMLNAETGLNLKSCKLHLVDKTYVQCDGIDESAKCICEIYAHIGALKAAQKHKLSTDLLKMLLVERVKGSSWRKIYCFADKTAAAELQGSSWRSLISSALDVEIHSFDLPEEEKQKIINAQKRQYR